MVEKGSFTAAARELYLTQPALSKQIANLERESGIPLFDRSGYKPVLTAKGRIFHRECLRLQDNCQTLLEQLREPERRPLSIGFTGFFENREIIEFINRFKTGEGLEVTFVKNSFEQCLQDLLEERVDVSFGIESTYRYAKGIRFERLHSYQMCVIAAPSHPLSAKDSIDVAQLRDEKLVCLSKEYGKGFYRDYMDAFAKDHITPKIVREADSFDELFFSVSVGEGIGIVAKHVVQGNAVRVLELKNSHHTSHYVVAYKKTLQDPSAWKFIEKIKEYFASIT